MKFGKLILSALAVTALLAGCKEKEEDFGAPSIKVNPSELTFEKEGGAQTLTVDATRDWTVENTADWVAVEPASGKAGSQTVTVTALSNEARNRSLELKFVAGGGMTTAAVVVKQNGAVETTYANLSDIRALGKGSKVPENTIVKAKVVSNNILLNNLTSRKNVAVQDETAGIQLRLTEDNKDYGFGDELEIDLSGMELTEYNGMLQFENLASDRISVLNKGTEVVAKEATEEDFLAGKYENQYVTLSGVQVVSTDLDKTYVVGDQHTDIEFEFESGQKFVVFSSKYSSYKDEKVSQKSGSVTGLASVNNSTIQLIFAAMPSEACAGMTEERFESVKPEPGEIKDVTVAEFLAAEVSDVNLYRLTGQMSGVADGDKYGNFYLTDDAGDKVYVYGLRENADAGNQTFQNLGLKNGYYVTLVGKRGEYNGSTQVVDAYYESHEEGELPEEPEATAPFTSSITWTIDEGVKAYDEKLNPNSTGEVPCLKMGTGSVNGYATLNIPEGTTKIGFYAVAWKGVADAVLSFESLSDTFNPRPNVGASNTSPYTITVTGSDYYTIDLSGEVTSLKVSAEKRVIIWGVNPVNE